MLEHIESQLWIKNTIQLKGWAILRPDWRKEMLNEAAGIQLKMVSRGAGAPPAIFPGSTQRKNAGETPAPQKPSFLMNQANSNSSVGFCERVKDYPRAFPLDLQNSPCDFAPAECLPTT